MKTLTNQEFLTKYHFPKPHDSRDRDMIIKSNLSDIQQELMFDPNSLIEKINDLKEFMFDTRDLL